MGDIIKTACDNTGDAPSEDPDGGNDDCIELSSVQSNCDSDNPLLAFEHRIWASDGVEVTYIYKIQTTYAGIAEGGLKLTCNYLDGVDGGSLTETSDDSAISQRANDADWSQTLSVTITPQEDGWVDLKMELMEYEANNEVYIWPIPTVS